MKNCTFLFVFSVFLIGCGSEKKNDIPTGEIKTEHRIETPVLEYDVISSLPHDTTSFTEGLLFRNNQLFESTGSPLGSNFKSVFGVIDPKTGKIDVKAEIDAKTYFGEGIVFFKNRIYQVTYQNHVCFVYDEKTFKKTGQFNYPNEGWGMTTDGNAIIMSDGTEVLSFFDENFKLIKTLSVKENGYAKENLNELEFINGFIYANVWMTGDIVKIDPVTGNVVGRINLTALSYEVKNFNPRAMEMNGIAFDAANDKIYITGKAWPKIYEVRFQH